MYLQLTTPDRFHPFSTEHFVMLGVFAIGCVAAGLLGAALREDAREFRVRRAFALLLIAFCVPLQILQLLPGDFTLGSSLPLQVCDLSWMLAAYALWTDRPWAVRVLYYWGLVLVTQALIAPALEQPFPDPRWWMFWGMHLFTIWAAVLLSFGLRSHRPTWAGLRTTILLTLGWVGSVMLFNHLTGTNYGYFNGKPDVASLLDKLGPWPTYVIAEIAIVATVFVLMTIPWTRRGAGEGAPSGAVSR